MAECCLASDVHPLDGEILDEQGEDDDDDGENVDYDGPPLALVGVAFDEDQDDLHDQPNADDQLKQMKTVILGTEGLPLEQINSLQYSM